MPARLRKAALPYLLLLPGLGWLLLFFAIPLAIMLVESLKTGTIDTGFELTWEFSNYTNALSDAFIFPQLKPEDDTELTEAFQRVIGA